MRILIVDDNEAVRRGVGQILAAEESWECEEAADSSEGLQKAQRLSPDVVLLDMNMPGISGLEAARVLRKEVPAARIVVMSQNDESLMQASAIQAGANACVDKARMFSHLVPTIRAVLEISAKDAVKSSGSGALGGRKPA